MYNGYQRSAEAYLCVEGAKGLSGFCIVFEQEYRPNINFLLLQGSELTQEAESQDSAQHSRDLERKACHRLRRRSSDS